MKRRVVGLRIVPVVALTIVAGALVASTAVGSPDGDAQAKEQAKQQQVAEIPTSGEPVDDGPVPTAEQQAVADRITKLLTPQGNKPKYGVPPSLDAGVVGVTGSPSDGYTVVLGKGADSKSLGDQLTSGLNARDVTLNFKQAERTTESLKQVWISISERGWITQDPAPGYTLDVDPATATVKIEIDDSVSAEELVALRKLGGDALTITTGDAPFRTSRNSDDSPHYGGANLGIGEPSYGDCSSGFTVRGRTTGTRYSLTAGHCGSNGSDWWSEVNYFGELAGKADFPDYDQARLKGSSYTNRIYSNGGDTFSSRLQTTGTSGKRCVFPGHVRCLSAT